MVRDWCKVPLDILADVALKLETLDDFNYFSAVCRWWSCAPPLIKNQWKPVMPLLLLAENIKGNPDCVREIFTLSNTTCLKLKLPEMTGARCSGSPYGWVAMIDFDLNILAFNPITKARLCFPPWNTLPNLHGCNSKHISKHNSKRKSKRNFKRKSKAENEEFHICVQLVITKLFLLKVHRNGHHEFVIAILSSGRLDLSLARHGDPSWTHVSKPKEMSLAIEIADIISIDGNIYALYDDGSIQYWNFKEIGSKHLLIPMAHIHFQGTGTSYFAHMYEGDGVRKMYLVQSGSDLLTVFRYKLGYPPFSVYDPNTSHRTYHFRIYKVGWVPVDDLGDVALFLGNNTSMSVSTTHVKYLRRNCIYFTDDENEFWTWPTNFGGHDMGVYDIKSAQILPLYEGDGTRSSFCPPMIFISQKS